MGEIYNDDPDLEGQKCLFPLCSGYYEWEDKPCYCWHTNPPCSNCTDKLLICSVCFSFPEEFKLEDEQW